MSGGVRLLFGCSLTVLAAPAAFFGGGVAFNSEWTNSSLGGFVFLGVCAGVPSLTGFAATYLSPNTVVIRCILAIAAVTLIWNLADVWRALGVLAPAGGLSNGLGASVLFVIFYLAGVLTFRFFDRLKKRKAA